MIYFEGVSSLIESIYLNTLISDKLNKCEVYVNPDNVKYLVGKTVIINSLEYPVDKIVTLLENSCSVISRIHIPLPGVNVQPYILKINKNIMWNGEYLDRFKGLDKLYMDHHCKLDWEHYTLTFPKIKLEQCNGTNAVQDIYGNLTALGWALQQVGINVVENTRFKNLDFYKLGKIIP